MPEFRQDPVTGQWVIIATDRAKRPETFAGKGADEIDLAALPSRIDGCPFCPGNESRTPPELLALGRAAAAPDTPGWRVRVVPNKYPALERKGQPSRQEHPARPLFPGMAGYGAHEVLVETPEHNRHPGALGREQAALIVQACHRRCRALAGDDSLKYVQIFRNHGRAAGASIQHPHSQLIALPFVPAAVREELERAQAYYLEHEACPYCALLAREREEGERIVAENDSFCAYMPYASRYPFETWLVPRRHCSSFLEAGAAELEDLAGLADLVLGSLARALDDPPYNLYLHGAPLRAQNLPYYHWHLELVPKLTTVAGFEMGAGVYINVTRPEEAARFIREKGGTADESRRESLLYPGPAQSSTRG